MKDVTAHLDQEATQSSRVGLQDLRQVAPPGRPGPQPRDGPLNVGLVRPLTQHDQVLTGHAPCCLQAQPERTMGTGVLFIIHFPFLDT